MQSMTPGRRRYKLNQVIVEPRPTRYEIHEFTGYLAGKWTRGQGVSSVSDRSGYLARRSKTKARSFGLEGSFEV